MHEALMITGDTPGHHILLQVTAGYPKLLQVTQSYYRLPKVKAIPIKFVVARAPPTQIQIPVENTKNLKHFHLIRIIKLGEIIQIFF